MRKEDLSIRQIASPTNRSYSTVRDWLVRVRNGRLHRRYDNHNGGHPYRLDRSQTRITTNGIKHLENRIPKFIKFSFPIIISITALLISIIAIIK